jgi:flagellar basal-body rod protein FlgG
MLRALNTSATGLEAQQANIERIANDLANVNTDGYKRGTIEFQDLMYETTKEPGQQQGNTMTTPVGVQKGMGVKVGAAHKIFEQGSAKITNNPYDIMVEGKGFIPVTLPRTGEVVYTRAGNFKLDSQGRISLSSGALLEPAVTVPPTSTSVVISQSGEIKAYDQQGGETQIGQIQLVNFVNMQGLSSIGNNFFKPTQGSGQPLQGVPGENGMGTVLQGALETSNVNVANSMIDMIGAQRGYEMNTRVMSVADKMLEATTNIVR